MKPLTWTPEMVAAFAPAMAASPWGAEHPMDVLAGSYLYEMERGPRRALVAARPVQMQVGKRLEIVAMVSLGERLQIEEFDAAFLPIVQAHKATSVAMCSKWPHVVRACARSGWKKTGTVMVKQIA